ncbi:MFS transporter [Glaciibacter psychrotolerans]|uniref:MFS family permease n=1 Tax=Glaciibacter psychrotolerans TaxID=670054 RepID=A0A7Z0J7E0_9MICO|nr:MFS transporter [Leifsonia psychrotolerans]NYJ20843.1 MFS family permease [Leifsonia psychrotolerans]
MADPRTTDAGTTDARIAGRASAAAPRRRLSRRSGWMPLALLIVNQLLAGVGVASGIAVGGLLAEQLSGTVTMAGLAQTSSVLGAGLVAIPLARLATRVGRHWALATGYALALVGTLLVFVASATGSIAILLIGLAAFGAASAAGLQARFAATEVASKGFEARSMSVVLWATTLGSVAGPNLSQLGSDLGRSLGIEPLAGPYLFSGVAFALSTLLAAAFLRTPPAGQLAGEAAPAAPLGLRAAVRIALRQPQAVFAIVAIVCSHTIMVGVMVMTPVHMNHQGMSLGLVGLVISVHIVGMYGASPLMGWLADRVGPARVIFIGVAILGLAAVIGALLAPDDMIGLSLALGLLGLGWSAGMIGGSALLTRTVEQRIRVPLQGATDAAMNLAAAMAAAASGLLLAWGGFAAVNVVAMLVLIPMIVFGLRARAHLARG